MKRRLRAERTTSSDDAERQESPAGLSSTDVFGPLRVCFTTTADVFTEHAMRIAIDQFDTTECRVEQHDLAALRSTVRAVVAEKLLDALRQQIADNRTESNGISRQQISVARESLNEFLSSRTRPASNRINSSRLTVSRIKQVD